MLACSIEIFPDRPASCPEAEALLVLNHRRSGGAGAGSAMRRRPVVNEPSRIPAIALSLAMARISKLSNQASRPRVCFIFELQGLTEEPGAFYLS